MPSVPYTPSCSVDVRPAMAFGTLQSDNATATHSFNDANEQRTDFPRADTQAERQTRTRAARAELTPRASYCALENSEFWGHRPSLASDSRRRTWNVERAGAWSAFSRRWSCGCSTSRPVSRQLSSSCCWAMMYDERECTWLLECKFITLFWNH